MSFSKNFLSKTPFLRGGYEGGGDVEGAYYVPTGQMYADMFGKIGQAVADIDKKTKEYGKKAADELAKAKKEREELENTEPFWDGTKWTRRPKPGLNTVISTTTKLG